MQLVHVRYIRLYLSTLLKIDSTPNKDFPISLRIVRFHVFFDFRIVLNCWLFSSSVSCSLDFILDLCLIHLYQFLFISSFKSTWWTIWNSCTWIIYKISSIRGNKESKHNSFGHSKYGCVLNTYSSGLKISKCLWVREIFVSRLLKHFTVINCCFFFLFYFPIIFTIKLYYTMHIYNLLIYTVWGIG